MLLADISMTFLVKLVRLKTYMIYPFGWIGANRPEYLWQPTLVDCGGRLRKAVGDDPLSAHPPQAWSDQRRDSMGHRRKAILGQKCHFWVACRPVGPSTDTGQDAPAASCSRRFLRFSAASSDPRCPPLRDPCAFRHVKAPCRKWRPSALTPP